MGVTWTVSENEIKRKISVKTKKYTSPHVKVYFARESIDIMGEAIRQT
jgi:hypothetical protein